MRKITALALIIILIVLSSCSPEASAEVEYGTLKISITSSERTIQPSADERRAVSYSVHIKSTFSDYIKDFTTAETSCVIENLESGNYEVYVEGLNVAGETIVKADKKTVTITSGQTATVSFSLMDYDEGKGTLSLTISIPVSDSTVEGVLFSWKDSENAESSEEKYITVSSVSADGRYRCYILNESLDAGDYDIAITIRRKAGESTSSVDYEHIDVVKIYDNLTSASSFIWETDFYPVVITPVISLESGTYKDGQAVSITCSNSRAVIYYTLDGTTPTESSNVYVNPIIIRGNTKLRAVAKVAGTADSLMVKADYTVKVENPTFSIPSNSLIDSDELEITTSTSGARVIYTTDGTDPSPTNGTVYSNPFIIRDTIQVKAVACKDGYDPSDIVSANYYDVSKPTEDGFFNITSTGAISFNYNKVNEVPSGIVIPSVLNGVEVVEIARNGFKNVRGFTYISIPDSVTKISDGAFFGCTDVVSIDVSTYVTDLGATAFSGWTSGQRINDYSGLIKTGTLENCSAKIYATVKPGIQSVGGYTGMDTLYGIYLSNNVTVIEDNAFSGCVNLEEFELPSYVTSIGSLAFNGCTKIESITLPDVLKSLSADTFKGWTSEQKIIDKSGILYTNGKIPNCDAKIYATTPSTLTYIYSNTVKGRTDLFGLEITPSVKGINDYAFSGTNIESIVIPGTIEEIGLEVFRGWTENQKVEIVYNGYTGKASSNGNSSSFSNSNADYSITIADGVTEIKDNAFNGMASLSEISIPDTVTKIGANAFRSTSLSTITLSPHTTSIGEGAFENCSNLASFTIPENVTVIGNRAFCNDDAIRTITVPDSVTSIGDRIFADCENLESVNLGSGITSIPQEAFNGSSSITSITAPNCMGSLTVTVKVPLTQLIVHDVVISVSPAYSSVYAYEKRLTRDDVVIDGDYRVYTYTLNSLLGLYYNVDVSLFDYENVNVGTKTISDVQVTVENAGAADFLFDSSDLTTRTLAAVAITPSESIYLDGDEITIVNEDADAIYYTTDGTPPTEFNGTEYTEPLVYHELTNVQAVAVKEGYSYSSVVLTSYTEIKVKAPTFSLESKTYYPSTQYLELDTATEGASIYYSTYYDYSLKSNGSLYKAPIVINATKTVRAQAVKEGFADSDVVEAEIKIRLPLHTIVEPSTGGNISIEWTKNEDEYTFSSSVSNYDRYKWYFDGDLVSSSSTWTTTADLTTHVHLIELKATNNGISYSTEFLTDTIFTYRVDLNNGEWIKDEDYTNQYPSSYDGVYKSYSNYHDANSTASMYIYVKGNGTFEIYVRSNAQTTYDYVNVYELDSTSEVKTSTSGKQNTSKYLSGYTKVEFTIPYDGEEHFIKITYLKDGSVNTNEDRGFVLIPKNQ